MTDAGHRDSSAQSSSRRLRPHAGQGARAPIGVFDSGIGGLTVVRQLLTHLPAEDVVYFGDTARVPYGIKSAETVTRFSRENTQFLLRRGVKMVVVACNSASAMALETLQREYDLPILGVIDPGAAAAVAATRSGKVGVIGTQATVGSRAYERAIAKRDSRIEVLARACPLFVPLAEEGWIEGEVPEKVARQYLAPLLEAGIDTLILGCTHYPILQATIQKVAGDGVTLIDTADATVRQVAERLAAEGLDAERFDAGRLDAGRLDLGRLDAGRIDSERLDTGRPDAGRFRPRVEDDGDAGVPDSPGAAGQPAAVRRQPVREYYVSDVPAEFRKVGERFLGHALESLVWVDQDDLPWYER